MNCKKIIAFTAFLTLLSPLHSGRCAWSDEPNYRYPLEVPIVPKGTKLIIYGPIPKGLGGTEGENATDWKNILEKMGIRFPENGFAIFYKPARILVVATDETNQALVSAICE